MPDLVVKAHDTFPPLVAVLYQGGAPLDLTTAVSIKAILKGQSVLVTGAATKLTVVTPTGTTALGSPIITAVSVMTSVVNGGSITGIGIPSGARVGSFDAAANTISMIGTDGNALNASASGSGITLTINKGSVSYPWGVSDLATVDTYNTEFEITWPGGIQTVPNAGYNTIQVVADLEGA